MQKIAINTCYGGFSLSKAALKLLAQMRDLVLEEKQDKYHCTHFYIKGTDELFSPYMFRKEKRTDPDLIEVIQELGKQADGVHAKLKIVEVPDGVEWEIQEYDGVEWVAEKHRTWS